ncbi:DNA-binding response regulator [Geomonas silvestris]|uniref:DNA-binding response regulator n=1 Tax=Geomonas silvestris TaxID=2740184 RepID=A0A6V8MHZ6_9BACT|nr:response regulator transcription factor [Geomonas silvestris]GFO59582.1 DNA-binding response regulator [Geomonas silvestris]
MIKVLIADDHPIFRRGLIQILNEVPDLFAIEEARSGEEALLKARNARYDLVLMDISMPGRGGLDALKVLKEHQPKLPVLVISMHPEEQYAVRAFRAGAAGYLNKECAWDELMSAVKKVMQGGKYISPSVAETLVTSLDGNPEKPLEELLSNREYQVFRMIADGKTVGAIALELALSVKTISTHRTRVLEKLNLANNSELMHYALTHNLTR